MSQLSQQWQKINIDTSSQSYPEQSSDKSQIVIAQLQNDSLALLSELNNYLTITSTVESKFPGIKTLYDKLLPLNIEFLNQASLAADEGRNAIKHNKLGEINEKVQKFVEKLRDEMIELEQEGSESSYAMCVIHFQMDPKRM